VLIAPSAESKNGEQDGVGQRLADRAEITDLAYCYAAGTDAIGAGDVALGQQIYAGCFTPDARIEASFPGADPNGPADLTAFGAAAWGDIVEGVFDSSGYVATQHLISNVRIDIDGNSASMISYLHATHVLDPAGSIAVANGHYVDQVVRTPQGWRIAARRLHLIDFVQLDSPAPGAGTRARLDRCRRDRHNRRACTSIAAVSPSRVLC
jgi:hypothetical protein